MHYSCISSRAFQCTVRDALNWRARGKVSVLAYQCYHSSYRVYSPKVGKICLTSSKGRLKLSQDVETYA